MVSIEKQLGMESTEKNNFRFSLTGALVEESAAFTGQLFLNE
jgi:hypothetical protein